MTKQVGIAAVPMQGQPAPLARGFGWGVLGALAAFLINNALNVGWGSPGLSTMFSDGVGAAMQPLLIYILCVGAGIAVALSRPNAGLRADAAKIHGFNLYIVRALFWIVFLTGIVDATLAVMRVEGLLGFFFEQATVREFTRSAFVAPIFHFPLIVSGFVIAAFTRTLGFTWLALLIVASELLIVFTRFIFSYEQALMGDLVRYWYAALFLFASAYTLYDDGHVRVDIIYAGRSSRTKGKLNAIGSIMLGMVTVWTILIIGMSGKTSIINAPIVNLEITQTGANGMFIKYQMAAFLAIFAATMIIQFVSSLFEAVADSRDEPGKRDNVAAAH
jgi:TRAP-type mannitol/chloroaromatic compound transport system permease small subunit